MKITLVTPTGGRPEAFALCEESMLRQTIDWHEWIVVDDFDVPTQTTLDQVVIRPEDKWQPGEATLARNIKLALEKVTGDTVIFIEDDDYYAPMHIERIISKLDYYDIVGETKAKYYHLPSRRYLQLSNEQHASLCQTGIRRKSMSDIMEKSLQSNTPFLDMILWKLATNSPDKQTYLFPETVTCIGLKGLPGRPGIGIGHNPPNNWEIDADTTILRNWLGRDVTRYIQYLQD